MAQIMVPWLKTAGEELYDGADFLLPIPLHSRRILFRKFNQSAELARGLSDVTSIPMKIEWLQRVRFTKQQVGLTRRVRKRNLKNAFSINKKVISKLKGAHVILVDDVMTTGATVEACTKVLRKAKVKRVDVLTVARVVKNKISDVPTIV